MRRLFLAVLVAVVALWTARAKAGINLPFSYSFSACTAQTIATGSDPCGVGLVAANGGCGSASILSDTNALGVAGNVWNASVCNGDNLFGAAPYVMLNTAVTEIWVRFYFKFASGFTWSGGTPAYYKFLYFFGGSHQACAGQPIVEPSNLSATNTGCTSLVGSSFPSGNGFQIVYESPPAGGGCNPGENTVSWTTMNGGSTGDGKWHCFEFHDKIDTTGGNGNIGQIWLDGNLILNVSNFAVGNYTVPINEIDFLANQNAVNNASSPQPVEIDDIALANNTYPPAAGWQHDGSGNQMIGTLGGSSNPGGPVRRFGPGPMRPW